MASSTALHATASNYKTALQEWLAKTRADAPVYRVLSDGGAMEAARFRAQVETRVNGFIRRAVGDGPTVKSAENAAAETLYAELTGER